MVGGWWLVVVVVVVHGELLGFLVSNSLDWCANPNAPHEQRTFWVAYFCLSYFQGPVDDAACNHRPPSISQKGDVKR